jgi:ABC-type phosphate transport system substrate-binding protein
MSLAQLDAQNALNVEATHTPLEVETEASGCVAPSLESLADGLYPFARTEYLYVNAESAARDEVKSWIEFALTDEAGVQALGASFGFSVPDVTTLDEGVANVAEVHTGRTFSRAFSPVDVLVSQEGTLRIAGSALLADTTRTIISNFQSEYTSAAVESDLLGNTAGWSSFVPARRMLLATRPATDDELAQCAAAGIEPLVIDLGYQALVFVVSQGNDWAECLTADQVAGLLRAKTDETPAAALWSEVDASWPERTLLLVAPPNGSGEADYIVQKLIAEPGETLGFAIGRYGREESRTARAGRGEQCGRSLIRQRPDVTVVAQRSESMSGRASTRAWAGWPSLRRRRRYVC